MNSWCLYHSLWFLSVVFDTSISTTLFILLLSYFSSFLHSFNPAPILLALLPFIFVPCTHTKYIYLLLSIISARSTPLPPTISIFSPTHTSNFCFFTLYLILFLFWSSANRITAFTRMLLTNSTREIHYSSFDWSGMYPHPPLLVKNMKKYWYRNCIFLK